VLAGLGSVKGRASRFKFRAVGAKMTNKKWLHVLGLVVLIVAEVGAAQMKMSAKKPTTAVDPGEVLARAREVMGFDRLGGAVVHTQWISAVEQPYQSDRTYPPFFSMMQSGESWFDPQTGSERTTSQSTYPGSLPGRPLTSLSNGVTRFFLREKGDPVAVPPDSSRNLNAWLVVADWSKAQGVRFAGREVFRDYSRIVLSITTDDGEQRLLLDPKTGFPVKLDYEESHYLWGQRKVQYVFSNWQQSGPIFTANTAFRTTDDEVEVSVTIGTVESMARDSAPSLLLPDAPRQAVDKTPIFLRPLPPKIIDVSATTYLLSNPGYNEVVTFVGDDVYVFDATQGEERAREDHEIIRKLRPSAKKINVIITDLSWPHIAGMRYWVANGATIVSHRAAQPFLQKVLDRRWTRNPDLYEKARRTVRFKFVGVDSMQEVAGGAVKLFPIDGIGSEVALGVFVVAERFLWASDYVQTLSEPSMYAAEVIAAVQRESLRPERVAAEHLPLAEWSKVIGAQEIAGHDRR
jgi:hypothetical protein